MIYVDTNVFVYPIIYDETVERKALEAMTASLTWDELTWIVRKEISGVSKSEDSGRG